MDFRILGPLEVEDDGRALPLGGAKQRALLAMLLLRANETVSRDRLIEGLWGNRPPNTAPTALQVHVSGLRKVLEPRRGRQEPQVLLTHPPGYLLRVDPDQLDLNLFGRLVGEGRSALSGGNAEGAASTLRTALALWRGAPLADLDSMPFVQTEVARLEELRFAALEERIEADLTLGRHADLTAELEQLVAANPLRERLRAQLMLALYRCGRQAAALDSYQAGRRLLAEDLGLEPGEELQRLERAILNHDSELDLATVTPSHSEQAIPTGTVTFVFTDVEGSTALVKQLGDDYAHLLEQHHQLLRDGFEGAGGHEIDTQGDAFFYTFRRARDAVRAAVETQRGFSAARWPQDAGVRIRVGIHTGEPALAQAGYHGLDVVRAARISGAAHGGQILVSSATRNLVGEALSGVSFLDLGEHSLKDVGRVRLYQVGEEDFPPLRTLSQTNLPLPPTPLLGRGREVAELREQLESARLVTITGPGGMGKTRLVLEVAAELVADFEDGVWFVDLSPVREPRLVEPTIVAALGASGELADHLRHRELLLVLDNLEQVVQAAPELGLLLESCPRLKLACTSREPLRLRAEREYPLEPLPQNTAVELFRQRALTIDPRFEGDDETLAELCKRLECMPLAIELAAARVKILAPDQLLARLERRLPMLTAGASDAPERQRTLRATIEWSYDLLDEDEQRLFARLGVFAGGWTFEAADEVCGASLDVLQSLAEKSLVRTEDGRFRMLETIREYALERLDESAEADGLRRLHAAYFLALAERAEPELRGPDQHVWLERLAVEYENLRGALEWSHATPGEAELGLRIGAALSLFYFVRGFYRDGLYWLPRLLEASEEKETQAYARALWGAGMLKTLVGEEERAEQLLEESLGLARRLGDDWAVAWNLVVLGLLAFFRNDLGESRRLFEDSAEKARRNGDEWCLADALATLGSIYPLQGEFERAEAVAAEALEIARRRDDRMGIRMALFGQALAAARQGRLDEARALGEQGLAVTREIGDRWFISYFLWILAGVATASGDLAAARAQAEESLEVARELQGPLLIVCALDALAGVARSEGDDAAAEAHLKEAERVGREAIVPHSYLASVVRGLGEIAAARKDGDEARRRLEEALALANGVGDAWEADRARAALSQL